MPKSTELKKKITLIYRGTLIGNIQVVKSGNILRKKSGWPVTLSFNAKRHGSQWVQNAKGSKCVLKCDSQSDYLSCIKVAERHLPTHRVRENSTQPS